MDQENDSDNEGVSTGKKVLAGAAIGVAVPAAVGVAKKLIGNGNGDDEQGSADSGASDRPQKQQRKPARSGQSRSSAKTNRANRPASKRGSSTSRSGSSSRSSGSQAKSSSSRQRSGSSSARAGNRTKEQLYNQAKRLKIEGRSSMTKAQLERAISRARS
jgi:hypothetical protein